MAALFDKIRCFGCIGLLALATTLAGQMPAQSQAGSTGGIVGQTNKSISGGEDARTPPQKESSRKSAARGPDGHEPLPSTIRIVEHATVANYTITLKKTGGNTYVGTWNHGYATTFTVTSFTVSSLTMLREDKPAFGAVTGRYTGQRSGNSAHGQSVVSNGFTPTWEATW
jgi:hypothetical protein